jgi:hypothetical protein
VQATAPTPTEALPIARLLAGQHAGAGPVCWAAATHTLGGK